MGSFRNPGHPILVNLKTISENNPRCLHQAQHLSIYAHSIGLASRNIQDYPATYITTMDLSLDKLFETEVSPEVNGVTGVGLLAVDQTGKLDFLLRL